MAQTFTSTDVTTGTNVFADNQSQRVNENTLRSNFSGSSQPSDPVVGQHWYDTGNNREMTYNGTSWVAVDTNTPTQIDVKNSAGNLSNLKSFLSVAHNDDGTLKVTPTSSIDEFKENSIAVTYVNPTTFTTPNDLTGIFTQYRKVKVYLSASTAISSVSSSSYDGTSNVTTVVLSTSAMDATLVSIRYSIVQYGTPDGGTFNGDITAHSFNGTLHGTADNATHADTASELTTARNIALTGDATGSATFDGSADANISVTVNESKHAAAANAINNQGDKTAIGDGTREPDGLELYQVYDNGYPASYGNLISIGGKGGGELLAEWSGADKGIGHLYYRNRRDTGSLWSDWSRIPFDMDVVNYVKSVNTGIVAASLAGNGYVKFANGFIIQWGVFPATTPGYANIPFPIAFPTACLNVQKTSECRIDTTGEERYLRSWSKTGFYAGYDSAGCTWLAIGY